MADLEELHRALQSAIADGGGHKVFFYAAGKNGAVLRHGFIAIVDPQKCQLNFEQMDNDRALVEIPQLSFIKIQSLPMIGQNPATGSNAILDTQHVLTVFDPAMQSASGAAARSVPARQASATAVASAQTAAAIATTGSPKLAHARLKEDATALLQNYYGNSAQQKVAEIQNRFSPVTQPAEFLDACRQLAAVLVGMPKATEVFRRLYEKID